MVTWPRRRYCSDRYRRPLLLALLVAGCTVAVAACGSGSGTIVDAGSAPGAASADGPGGGRHDTTTTGVADPARKPGRDGGVGGITAPDNFTALTLTPVHPGAFPFAGSDGRYHVAYDLQLTNASPVPATLERIDVVDGADPTTVIASFSGPQLVKGDCADGDCSRLRTLPAGQVDTTAIPPQQGRALFVDIALDRPEQFPAVVLHHLYGTGQPSPPVREPKPIDYLTTPFSLSAGTARVISPPLRGDNWVALNGCCQPGYNFPHRVSLNTLNGKLNNSQRFAIDWKRTNEAGEFYRGDKTKNESYADYGEPVYAVADGVVTSVLDDVDANAPGVLPATDPVLAAKLTIENVDGNHVIMDIGGGVFAMFSHFQKGSIPVHVGDRVKRGQLVGRLGNTGNSNASHLHFQLMDGPSLLGANGLPYVIDRFDYAGQVAPQQILDADDYLSGEFLQGKLPIGQPRTDELPLLLAIVNFPEP
jgi:hypothetical protein